MVLADTGYWLALANVRDRWHERAVVAGTMASKRGVSEDEIHDSGSFRHRRLVWPFREEARCRSNAVVAEGRKSALHGARITQHLSLPGQNHRAEYGEHLEMSNNAKSSAKTYRKTVNMLSDALGIDRKHTQYPKDDFEGLVKRVKERTDKERTDPDAIKKQLIGWYKRGIRRGYIRACDAIIDPNGELALRGDVLHCNSDSIKVRVRFKIDGKWHRKAFTFSSEDLEFKE